MEYGILILKPDGNNEACYQKCISITKDKGLELVAENDVLATSEDIHNFFYSGVNESDYISYMTSGNMKGLLFKGENAQFKLYRIKLELRAYFRQDSNDMENKFHSPDNGTEYCHQFKFFFPHLNIGLYSQYADLDIGEIVDSDEEKFSYINETNICCIGINNQYWKLLSECKKDFLMKSGKDIYIFKEFEGKKSDIEYSVRLYLKCDSPFFVFLSTLDCVEDNVVECINTNKGFVLYLWNDSIDILENIGVMRAIGVNGAYVYGINRTVESAHIIDDNLHQYRFGTGGGSEGGGIGTISIGERMLQRLLNYKEEMLIV